MHANGEILQIPPSMMFDEADPVDSDLLQWMLGKVKLYIFSKWWSTNGDFPIIASRKLPETNRSLIEASNNTLLLHYSQLNDLN